MKVLFAGARPAGVRVARLRAAGVGARSRRACCDDRRARAARVREAGQPRIERRHLEGEDARRSWCRRSSWRSQFDRKVVVEAAVPNAREIECAVLGNDDPKTSVPGEIIPSREFYDYEAKYLDEGSKTRDSGGPAAGHGRRGAAAGDRGVPRDRRAPAWRASTSCWSRDTGAIYLNEINTMPGFTTISMYSKMWEAVGRRLRGAGRPADSTGARAARREAEAEDERAVKPKAAAEADRLRCFCLLPSAFCLRPAQAAPQRGITAAPTVARAYDLILDADFDGLDARRCRRPARRRRRSPAWASRRSSLWWQIQLDPESRALDARVPGRRSMRRSPKPNA